MATLSDDHLSSPAALRNRDAILDVLRKVLPTTGKVLEIASGSGEHIIHFAASLPELTWIPSDPSDAARASVGAWRAEVELSNILAPLDLDASAPDWPIDRAHALLAINLVHISPWAATIGLLKGASHILPTGGLLYLYGPYVESDRPLATSNIDFDADLKARNPAWGLRHLDEVTHEASLVGLRLERSIAMPANNLSVIFKRS